MLFHNQSTCVVALLCLMSTSGGLWAVQFGRLQRWLGCAFMAGEKCRKASYQGPCRRTKHSDHSCNDDLERPQIVRGWVFRSINSDPCEDRSGYGSTYSKNHRQETGLTNCAGGSG
jgi:hypothetical protein